MEHFNFDPIDLKFNRKLELVVQVAYSLTRKMVKICQEQNYSLSFAGYLNGAWFAEICVGLCYFEFDFDKVRAVTLDSLGTCKENKVLKLKKKKNLRKSI